MRFLYHQGIFILFLLLLARGYGQPACTFEHFTVRDGLAQSTINNILQDNKGFIWLATYDGLSQFDGYEFHNYKVKPGDPIQMKSNRADRIHVDKYNRIWIETSGEEAHCFDPMTKKFWGLTDPYDSTQIDFALSHIEVKPSGKVWLLSQLDGCICVIDSTYKTRKFNKENQSLPDDIVSQVFEDKNGNSWLLTNRGLAFLPSGETGSIQFFFAGTHDQDALPFYSAYESDNEIWFGSEQGKLFRYLKEEKAFIPVQTSASSRINFLSQLDPSTLFLATAHDGFLTFDLENKQFKAYNPDALNHFNTRNLHVEHLEKPDKVWFSNDQPGIYKLNLASRKIDFFSVQTDGTSIASSPSAFILTDKKNRLWVHPSGGGFSFYDETANKLMPFFNPQVSEQARFSNILHTGFFDRQGNLWLGSRSHGLEKIVFNENPFSVMKVEPDLKTLFGNNVRAIMNDHAGKLWVASKENKLYVYNPELNSRVCLSPDGRVNPQAVWPSTVYCIFQDSHQNIWLGTRGSGIYQFIPTDHPEVYRVVHSSHNNDPFSLSNNNVYSIFEDKQQRIWAATLGGGLNLVEQKDNGSLQFIHARNRMLGYPKEEFLKARFVSEDQKGHICVGTTDGFLMFDSQFESPENIRFRKFQRIPGEASSLGNNDVIDMLLTQNGELYLATSGGGLNRALTYDGEGFPETFKSYMREEGIPSDLIVSISEDFNGKLWVGTESGLFRFDPGNEHIEVFSDVGRLLGDHSFSESTRCVRPSGEIMLGYTNGILRFFPEDIKTNRFVPYLALTNLQVFNKNVAIGPQSAIQTNIDDCRELTLTHKQNFFSIEFAALDFVNPPGIQYAYRLEGFDSDWNYAQSKRMANYTKIPKGEYLFRVKSTNGDGIWVPNERALPITIKPAPWETPLAYVLYFIVFALVIFLIDYNLLTIYRLKSTVAMEKKMSDLKQKFFVDISHEIRTPLTMITAPVEYMLNDHRTPEAMKKQLSFISQSSNRMLRLVNQILDFRKVQDTRLEVQEIDPGPILYEIFNNFTELARENEIDFQFRNQAPCEKIWANRDSLEKIMMNLLSNAFKYTAKGKSIRVKLATDYKTFTLSVTDEGAGISKEKQKNLFVRFMSFNDDPSKPSTGIGLSLIRELAEKLGAKVTVESELGKGSCFSVRFLKGNSHFANQPDVTIATAENKTSAPAGEKIKEPHQAPGPAKETKKVLIVEDDNPLRQFMISILEEEYTVLEASDGMEGLAMAGEQNPDFIVSDIMMPRMDGIELLKRLRTDLNTSHIPIILLTAKTNIEGQLEGLSYGADDYLTKPFSVPYFKARIVNLLEQRKRLQEIFGKTTALNLKEYHPKPFLISSHDEEIMERVMGIIEQNIDKVDFTIEELATTLGINRTSFQNKIKSLTSFTPVEFVRDIRLKRAAQLITDSQLLIKEISYLTGFTDTKYFGKCFREKFGLTPVEYRNRK